MHRGVIVRLGVLMVTLLGVVWSTYATTPEGEVGGRKKVGLVLSGGGAKGAAQLRSEASCTNCISAVCMVEVDSKICLFTESHFFVYNNTLL